MYCTKLPGGAINVIMGWAQTGVANGAQATVWTCPHDGGLPHVLKMIKRSAYARMKLDLLRQRVLHAA